MEQANFRKRSAVYTKVLRLQDHIMILEPRHWEGTKKAADKRGSYEKKGRRITFLRLIRVYPRSESAVRLSSKYSLTRECPGGRASPLTYSL
jgi:hypothetical protein